MGSEQNKKKKQNKQTANEKAKKLIQSLTKKKNVKDMDSLYLNERPKWLELVRTFTYEVSKLRKEIHDMSSKSQYDIKQIESTLKESLQFVEDMVQNEMDRNDSQKDNIDYIEQIQKEHKDEIQELQQMVLDVSEELKNMQEHMNNGWKDDLIERMMANMQNNMENIISNKMDNDSEYNRIKLEGRNDKKLKSTVDWTKILISVFTQGGIGYLILEQVIANLG